MLHDLKASLRPALVLTLLFAALLGLAYPLAITGLAQALFPAQANGSLVRDDRRRVIGSALIGQGFASAAYFHGRPSAAGKGYDAMSSAGSNLGPASRVLADRLKANLSANQTSPGSHVPADLVTTSASGLDPHLSPEAALFQADRVARARGLAPGRVRALVRRRIEAPALGFIGEPRVNVLALNRALDAEARQR
jgi:potassium-transporting ATPase KdpC subunit